MAFSSIIITQAAVPGAAGVSRDDLITGAVVTLTNDSDGDVGVHAWEWELIEIPRGSTASLTGALTATATFTPDVEGRYVIGLRVNGLSNKTNGYSRIVGGVRYGSYGTLPSGDEFCDWLPPAAWEGFLANWGGNAKGAQPELHRIIEQARLIGSSSSFSILGSLLGIPGSAYIPFTLSPALVSSTNAPYPAGYVVAGYLPELIVPSQFQSAVFYACIRVNGVAGNACVRVYDVTHGVAVAGLERTDSSLTPIDKLVDATAIGANPGDVRNDAPTRYALEISHNPGLGGDLAEVYAACLVLTPTSVLLDV